MIRYFFQSANISFTLWTATLPTDDIKTTNKICKQLIRGLLVFLLLSTTVAYANDSNDGFVLHYDSPANDKSQGKSVLEAGCIGNPTR